MKKSRIWFVVIAVLALGLLLFSSRDEFEDAWQLTKQIDLFMLIFMVIAARSSSFFWLSKYYQKSLLAAGYEVEQKELAKDALATNFVNVVFPSVGLAGASWLSIRLKDQYSVPYGVTTLVQLLRYTFNLIAFLILLFVSFTSDLGLVAVSLTVILMLLTTSTIFNLFFIMRGTSFVYRFAKVFSNYLNLFVKFITFNKKQGIINSQRINDKLESFNYQYKKLEKKSKEFIATWGS